MVAERAGVLGSILHVGRDRHHETSQVSVAAKPHKTTREEYLNMVLTQPYLMDGSEPPPHLRGKRMPVNDWAPYPNPAAETGRDV